MPRTIIFTDLDGTLLDRHTYSWSEAADAVQLLKSEDIPIVFCSSKTRVEQRFYQEELGIQHPLVVENGSAIIFFEGYFATDTVPRSRRLDQCRAIELGCESATIRAALRRIRKQLGLDFRGFAEMTDDELSALTGLCGQQLTRARQKDYSETIEAHLIDSEWTPFHLALGEEKLACTSGGHLQTVTSAASDKGRAVQILTELYRNRDGDIRTVGLGDSPNDRAMLEQVDIAYQVQRPDGTWYDMQLPAIRKVGIGPRGWSEAINSLLRPSSPK